MAIGYAIANFGVWVEREVEDIWIFAPKLFEFSRQKYRGNVID